MCVGEEKCAQVIGGEKTRGKETTWKTFM